jgi:hypothetical protein
MSALLVEGKETDELNKRSSCEDDGHMGRQCNSPYYPRFPMSGVHVLRNNLLGASRLVESRGSTLNEATGSWLYMFGLSLLDRRISRHFRYRKSLAITHDADVVKWDCVLASAIQTKIYDDARNE